MEAMRSQWIAFYDAEWALVIRFVMKASPASLENARDAAQEAFVESWREMVTRPDEWSRVNRRGWIRTVALRRFRRPPGPRCRPLIEPGVAMPDLPAPGVEPGEHTVQVHTVLEALSRLEPVEREVVVFLSDGFRLVDIPGLIDLTEQKARDIARSARTKLKRHLAAAATPEGGAQDERRRR
jgi:DNA-directed RNA polymerase specialized sigma24 family protein